MPEENLQPYFEYLEELRDSGVTNMLGAGRYLASEFGLPVREANRILFVWIKSFEEKDPCQP